MEPLAGLPLILLFDEASSTHTYIVYDPLSREAAIIDPVLGQVERDLREMKERKLVLRWCIETHAHADHITGSGALAAQLGAQTAAPQDCLIDAADVQLKDGDQLHIGHQSLCAIQTPGHTPGSTCFLWSHADNQILFSGDTLLIDGCGRTDFQGGSAAALYHSITEVLFALPDDTILCPGHDYAGRTHSTIGRERLASRRLAGRTREEFIALMDGLDLPMPRMIEQAVPANRKLGL